MTNTNT